MHYVPLVPGEIEVTTLDYLIDSHRAAQLAVPHKPGLRFHDLRHTCAGLLIAQGAHPKVIQERLGHASIAITMDRYGHLLPALDQAVVTGLEATYHAAQGYGANQ